MFIFNGIVK